MKKKSVVGSIFSAFGTSFSKPQSRESDSQESYEKKKAVAKKHSPFGRPSWRSSYSQLRSDWVQGPNMYGYRAVRVVKVKRRKRK